jgi:putative membrane protein
MSDAEKQVAKSLVKGLLAGLIGGLVATAAKSLAERIYPPRREGELPHGEPKPPEMLAERLAGHELVGTEKEVAVEAS